MFSASVIASITVKPIAAASVSVEAPPCSAAVEAKQMMTMAVITKGRSRRTRVHGLLGLDLRGVRQAPRRGMDNQVGRELAAGEQSRQQTEA